MSLTDLFSQLNILAETVQIPENHDDRVALIGMFSAIAVALITGAFALMGSRGLRRDGSPSSQVALEHEAWERWFLLNDIDPRLILTGYETIDEVRRVL